MPGFIVWAVVGLLLVALGVGDLFAKKPVGFWANAETVKVDDVKGYNQATGKLFIVYGVIFILLGLPLLAQNKLFILFSMIGVMFETIITMAVYSLSVEQKYRADKKQS